MNEIVENFENLIIITNHLLLKNDYQSHKWSNELKKINSQYIIDVRHYNNKSIIINYGKPNQVIIALDNYLNQYNVIIPANAIDIMNKIVTPIFKYIVEKIKINEDVNMSNEIKHKIIFYVSKNNLEKNQFQNNVFFLFQNEMTKNTFLGRKLIDDHYKIELPLLFDDNWNFIPPGNYILPITNDINMST